MTLGKKRLPCELFYLLVRYSEVAGMLFEAPTPITFSVFQFLFCFLSVYVNELWYTDSVFFCTLHLPGGCVIIL